MKRFVIFAVALLLTTWFIPAAGEPGWTTDFDQALHTAATSRHPVILDFSATWCGPCQMMARTTLRDPAVLQKLNSFVKVKVDIDANAPLAERFGIHAVPTFVVVNQDAEELARTSGAMDAAAFNTWLSSALSTAAFSASRREMFGQERETVVKQLKDPDAGAREKAVELLLSYSFRKEKYYRDFAAANLKTALKAHPPAFVPFLNDPKLAVRIMVANLFRDQFGTQFSFDPWAKAPERIAMMDSWKARLASEKR